MPHPVLDAASRYRAQLLAQERQAATRLVAAYGRAYSSTQAAAQALANEVAMISQQGGTVAEASIRRLASLQSLQRQIVDQVERYAVYADREIVAGVERAIELGVRGSRDTVLASFTGSGQVAAMRARWDMLPAESIETMLGFTAEGSPLRSRLVGVLGEAVAQRAGEALVQGIATGMGPRAVADVLRRELGAGLTWSLTTARTAQLWAYRDSTRLSYLANNDVVAGWKWFASVGDPRTCASCYAQHGSIHDVGEVLADHHQGRCVAIPIVPLAARLGLKEPDLNPGDGEKAFRAMPEAAQKTVLGPSMWEAWRNNDFDFRDLSRGYVDPVYGQMLRASTLREVIGEQKARTYMDMSRVAAQQRRREATV